MFSIPRGTNPLQRRAFSSRLYRSSRMAARPLLIHGQLCSVQKLARTHPHPAKPHPGTGHVGSSHVLIDVHIHTYTHACICMYTFTGTTMCEPQTRSQSMLFSEVVLRLHLVSTLGWVLGTLGNNPGPGTWTLRKY